MMTMERATSLPSWVFETIKIQCANRDTGNPCNSEFRAAHTSVVAIDELTVTEERRGRFRSNQAMQYRNTGTAKQR